ncbi:alpha beta hydrolase [Trichoderma arundinaceum]|uniref:Alpha beta hydrolase n=1 Tax=Trichoderma arundinaceum TaxID=490622 RepID=A0A395NX25_TRIAR|nr:alpha beta hydrolase [Trichoderma arundinaceum]
MHRFFKGEFFHFETVRILGMAPHGGADVAEVLEAVGQIKDGDPSSWEKAWIIQAQRAEALAEEACHSGDQIAARRAYLRASNYTRAAAYMRPGEGPNRPDPRHADVCDKVNSLFRKATALFDCGVEYLNIPFDGQISFPSILYLPPPHRRTPGKTPVLIATGGADALQEELYYMHPAVGPDLGYAVLTFEGPGQGLTLRRHDIKMRPDWEVVVSSVLDYVENLSVSRPELDLDTSRIAIAGASLGGYFALRAAADPRIKACIAIDPLYSMWDFVIAHVSPVFIGAWERGWLSNGFVDFFIRMGMRSAFQMRWEVSISGTFFGISSPALIMQEMKHYSLTLPGDKCYLDRVKCPVLVSGASESLYIEADHHTMRVVSGLTHQAEVDKEVWMANTPGQGSLQAKMGAMQLVNQKTFKFLDHHFGIDRDKIL